MGSSMGAGRPRFRYIAFLVQGPRAFTAAEVRSALHGLSERPRLVRFHDGRGLAGCEHLRKDATIDALRSIEIIAGEPVRITTLGTSGTIRRASMKYLE